MVQNIAMATEEEVLQRVEKALADGKVWRAKEILRGNIGSRGYSPLLYERYGQLLLGLAEDYEAGRYLFLSSQRHDEYRGAIDLYLSRARKIPPKAVASGFPQGARLGNVSAYPEPLRTELRKLGVTYVQRHRRAPAPRAKTNALTSAGCFLIALALILLSVVGLLSTISWLLRHV